VSAEDSTEDTGRLVMIHQDCITAVNRAYYAIVYIEQVLREMGAMQ